MQTLIFLANLDVELVVLHFWFKFYVVLRIFMPGCIYFVGLPTCCLLYPLVSEYLLDTFLLIETNNEKYLIEHLKKVLKRD